MDSSRPSWRAEYEYGVSFDRRSRRVEHGRDEASGATEVLRRNSPLHCCHCCTAPLPSLVQRAPS